MLDASWPFQSKSSKLMSLMSSGDSGANRDAPGNNDWVPILISTYVLQLSFLWFSRLTIPLPSHGWTRVTWPQHVTDWLYRENHPNTQRKTSLHPPKTGSDSESESDGILRPWVKTLEPSGVKRAKKPSLVGGFKHEWIIMFHFIYWMSSFKPIDELHHFSRWWNSTTNQKLSEVSFDDFPIIRYDWRRLNIRLPSWRSPLCAEKKPKLVLFLPNKKESIKGLTCKHWMV